MKQHDITSLPTSPRPPEGREWRETSGGDSATLSAKVRVHIRTLDELMTFFEVDSEQWEVLSWACNQWEQGARAESGDIEVTPLHQVKATFSRRKAYQAEKRDIKAAMDDARKEFARTAPKLTAPPKRRNKEREHLLIPAIFDPHFGKLAWGAETGWADYDLATAEKVFMAAAESLARKAASYHDDTARILIPIGNDLLHIDNGLGTTTRGTQQDCSGRPFEAYRLARQTMMRMIRLYREIAPVQVLIVPGNHDTHSVFHLGDALDMAFSGDKFVNVNCEPTSRKYHVFGSTLIGFDHGIIKPARLRELMQLEMRQAWGQTTRAEWLIGHGHTKADMVSALDEDGGVRIRRIPSLTPPDFWHSQSGYVGNTKAAEMLVYHSRTGYDAQFSFTAE